MLEIMSTLSLVNGLDFGLNFSTDSRLFSYATSHHYLLALHSVVLTLPQKKKRKKEDNHYQTWYTSRKNTKPLSHNIKPKKNRFYSY